MTVLAIVGATGAVGSTMIEIIDARESVRARC
jgi:aspartate-semialdehyde dehydrogenase